MSLCDVCPRPGRCCTGFHLGPYGDFAQHVSTPLEALCEMARLFQPDGNERRITLPFLPLLKESEQHGNRWRWWCPNLTVDGRCGDYENRPALCRDYQPGSDRLCALRTNAITAALCGPESLSCFRPVGGRCDDSESRAMSPGDSRGKACR